MFIDLVQAPHVEREIGNRTEENRKIARRFDKEFFDGERANGYGGYTDGGRYRPIALRLMLHYGLWKPARVLDVGCAKGYLVNDLRQLGVIAEGIDVSAYAISKANDCCFIGNAKKLEYDNKAFDLAVSITTIHNLGRDDCATALQELVRVSEHQYVTVDAWRTNEERKRMEAWNLTAKTMMRVDDWIQFFEEVGYTGDYGWFIP